MLGVLGADPAVVRAALGDLGSAPERLGAGLAETLDVEIALGIAVDDGLEPPWSGHVRPRTTRPPWTTSSASRTVRQRAGRSIACAPARTPSRAFRRWLRIPGSTPKAFTRSVLTSGVKMRSLQRLWEVDVARTALLWLWALGLGCIEIEIEGGYGWARAAADLVSQARARRPGARDGPPAAHRLPRVRVHDPARHRPPPVRVRAFKWSVAAEFSQLAVFFALAVIWDYIWFVMNPAYTVRRFRRDDVWWFQVPWIWRFPLDYYVGIGVSIALAALAAVAEGAPPRAHLRLVAGLVVLTALSWSPSYHRWYVRAAPAPTIVKRRRASGPPAPEEVWNPGVPTSIRSTDESTERTSPPWVRSRAVAFLRLEVLGADRRPDREAGQLLELGGVVRRACRCGAGGAVCCAEPPWSSAAHFSSWRRRTLPATPAAHLCSSRRADQTRPLTHQWHFSPPSLLRCWRAPIRAPPQLLHAGRGRSRRSRRRGPGSPSRRLRPHVLFPHQQRG